MGGGSRGGSELTGANGDAQDTAHTRGSTPGPSSQGGSDYGPIGPSHNRRSTSIKPKSKDEAAQMVSKLGSQRINNIFTHLRKICQHPLLVRHHFTDEKVSQLTGCCVDAKSEAHMGPHPVGVPLRCRLQAIVLAQVSAVGPWS